jgi:type IV secretion system protein VirB6
MNLRCKNLFLLLMFFFLISGVTTNSNAWGVDVCSDDGSDCSSGSCADKHLPTAVTDALSNTDSKSAYVCGTNATIPTASGSSPTPYIIGWAENCGIPGGGGKNPDNKDGYKKSCLTTNNFFQQALSTILTLGIGKAMMNNFCSFIPGDTALEGAIIKSSFLSNCANISDTSEKQNCIKTYMNGQMPSAGTLINSNLTSDPCLGIPNLDKPVIDSDDNFVTKDGKQAYCPIMRCNIPTDDIKVRYDESKTTRTIIMAAFTGGVGGLVSLLSDSCCNNLTLSGGSDSSAGWMGFVQLKGVNDGDRVCTKMFFGIPGWTTVACKYKVPPEIKMSKTSNCNNITAISCSTGIFKSKAFMPITSKMMQCVTELLYVVFKSGCDTGELNPIAKFQVHMRNTIQVLLVLYVIFFGIKIALGGIPKKTELWMFIIKIGLISYFAIGNFTFDDAAGASDVKKNGLEFLFTGALTAMSSFANMVAGNDSTVDSKNHPLSLCKYNKNEYEPAGDANKLLSGLDYSFLALWDSLDCRLAFYMGLAAPTLVGKTMAEIPLVGAFTSRIISYLWAAFFSFNFIFLIFLFIFSILLLSIVVFLSHVYIIAMIAISIMIFMGPIFIPLSLFEQTKHYFDGWLKLLMGYTLQPAVIVAFVVLMMGVFDQVIYKGCSDDFVQSNLEDSTPYWVFKDAPSETCKTSYGYKMANTIPGKDMKSINMILFDVYKLVESAFSDFPEMLKALMLCAFFSFLFYYFAQQLAKFAADVSQSSSLGDQAIGATKVFDTVKDAAEAVIDKQTGGAYSKAKQAAEASGMTGGGSGGVGVSSKAGRKGDNPSGTYVSKSK